MKKLFKIFNENFFSKAKIIVIGGEIRKILAQRNVWTFPDLLDESHIDILIEISDINNIQIVEEILSYFKAISKTDLCYVSEYDGLKLEFIGIVIKERLYSIKMSPIPFRPDLTIERFGYYNDGSLYDESKSGWDDFFSKKIVLMNDNLFLQKYFKVMSIKSQTGFEFDRHTEDVISKFENNLLTPKRKQKRIFEYNTKLFRHYEVYSNDDEYKVGIHVALWYLRAQKYSDVTKYIEMRPNLKKFIVAAGVNYHNFEIQAKNGNF